MMRPTCDYQPIEQFASRDVINHAVLECLRLGLFDTLENGPVTAEEVAQTYDLQPEPTEALLELFAAHNLLVCKDGGYENSPAASEYLVSSSRFYQGKAMELNARFNQYIVNEFMPLLKGDRPAREHTDDSWGSEDMMHGTLQYALLGALQDTVQFVAGLPNFSDFRAMADIGGNHGEFSMALVDLNPNLHSVIVDLPGVVEAASRRIGERGYAGRVEATACDLREKQLPEDTYDLVLASHVLYGFMDDLPAIVKTIHNALKSGGWFVAQHKDPASNTPPTQKYSLEFVTRMVGYRTHFISRELLESTLSAAGFENIRTAPTGLNQCGLLVVGQRV